MEISQVKLKPSLEKATIPSTKTSIFLEYFRKINGTLQKKPPRLRAGTILENYGHF
jgi:hypothetical protein